MKLTIVCSLVALALCCSWASAQDCPRFPVVAHLLIHGMPNEYLQAIQCFQPDEAMETAGKLLKAKVDTLSDATKEDIGRLMGTVASAQDCPSFPEVAHLLIHGTPNKYLQAIQCFQPNEAMEAAGKLLKAKVDTLLGATKADIGRLMVKIMSRN